MILVAILLTAPHHPPHDITIRHIGSVHHLGDVTTLAFEITNHTADRYFFHPSEIQLREGNAWVKFRAVDQFPYKFSELAPRAAVSLYTVDVTNLPVGSVVRFKIRPQKVLLGLDGFIRRAELDLKRQTGASRRPWISLNPYDTNGSVWGLPTEVVCEEWVETEADMFPYLNR
jgi:hypothetical protein